MQALLRQGADRAERQVGWGPGAVDSWVRALVWVVALATTAVPAVAREGWQQLTGPDFTVLSDARVRDLERFALEYAAYRQTVREFFAPEHGRMPRPVIVLFRRERDFEQHAPKSTKRDFKLAVFTTEIDSLALLTLPLEGDRRRALRLAFEFDTIWTLRRLGFFVPTWMSQGAGEVLSTHRLNRGERLVGVGGDTYPSALQQEGLMRWQKFFGIGVGSAEYDGAKATGQFHAQAWGLMHWLLLSEGDGRVRFRELAARLRQEEPQRAVELVMGVDDLERAGRRHVHGSRTVQRRPFDEAGTRAGWTIAAARPVEVQVYLADLLAASGSIAEADWQVEQALNAEPANPVVLEAAARRELRARRPDLAIAHYRAAAEAGSINPMAYLRSAEQRLNDSSGRRGDVAGSGIVPAVNAALVEIRRAIELDPGNPDGYRLLGRALFLARDISPEAVEELSHGVGPGPAGIWARFYRGLVAGRLEQLDTAKRDFERLAAEADVSDAMRAEARRQHAIIRLVELEKEIQVLIGAKDLAAARRRWVEGAPELADAHVRSVYAKLGGWLKQHEAAAAKQAGAP